MTSADKMAGDVRKPGAKIGASKTVSRLENESNLASKKCVRVGALR
jgi:hypothetical protein